MGPRATVVIPCLDAAGTLERTLEALDRQTIRRQLLVLVVDNGSADASMSIAERWADGVVAQPVRGSWAARNMGLALCETPFLLSLDADTWPVHDSWAQDHLEALVASGPRVLATAGPVERAATRDFWARQAGVTPQPGLGPQGEVLYPVGGNRCARVQMLRELGGFRPVGADDAELGRRARAAGASFSWVPGAAVWHQNPEGWRGFYKQMVKVGGYIGQLEDPAPREQLAFAWRATKNLRHLALGRPARCGVELTRTVGLARGVARARRGAAPTDGGGGS